MQRCKRRLKKRAFRITAARACIMEIFENNKGSLSAEDIFLTARKKGYPIGIATVYRTLDLMTRTGYLNKYLMPDGSYKYSYKEKKEMNINFICYSCGKIISFSELPENLKKENLNFKEKMENKYELLIKDIQINFYGLCNKCKQENINKNKKEVR